MIGKITDYNSFNQTISIMKTNLFKNAGVIVALCALCAISCQKETELDTIPLVSEDSSGQAILNISLSNTGLSGITKVSGDQTSAESRISNVQVFVFRPDGMLDASKYWNTASTTLEPLKCTIGERSCWVVVNAPEDYTGTVSVLSDLTSKNVILTDNADDKGTKLIMVGNEMKDSSGKTVTKLTTGTMNVKVEVSRLVSAVSLVNLVNDMQAVAFQSSFYYRGAYLMNVPGLQTIDGTVSASSTGKQNWYAWYAKASSDPSSLISETLGSPSKVEFGKNFKASVPTFYSFPSDIGGDLDNSSTKNDRVEGDGKDVLSSTYLIVEATVGSGADAVDCVYPVLLPQLKPNKKYNVSLTVNHIGGDPEKPWEKIEFSDLKPVIEIVDWDEKSISEII